ncbi:hypothetical protein U9M48_018293 [Paspalum notatum var. saurae]|uniref:Uncharacterized protein n=1 Tax=Paspalum notatum var. saurae TaxID=547442 RepID=A0AAQ3WQ66_PASNO
MAASSAIRLRDIRPHAPPSSRYTPAPTPGGRRPGRRPDFFSSGEAKYDGRGKGGVRGEADARGVRGGGRGAGGRDKGGGQGLRLFFPCLAAVLGCPATTPRSKTSPGQSYVEDDVSPTKLRAKGSFCLAVSSCHVQNKR